MVVSDIRMGGDDGLTLLKKARELKPQLPFLLVTAFAEIRDAVAALKSGAVDYLAKPVDLTELVAAVEDELGVLDSDSPPSIPEELLEGIIARSPLMKALLADAYTVSQSDVTVLLTGESGTGKDVVARFIHRAGNRSQKPFVAINCASISGSLMGSELFGHVKGAFTGASVARPGLFREAHNGTVFLDEIGDMPMDLQPSLLRVLEAKVVVPLGSDREVSVDNRLIGATNSNLEESVANGTFRSDLFYRLNVITLNIPPLRDRVDDILPVARYFLSGASTSQKRFSRAAVECLETYNWPGNVRELVNAVQRAALLSRTELILPEHFPPALRRPVKPSPATASSLQDTEKDTILCALRETNGNRTHAAGLLGITRRGLIYKLKRLGLDGKS
jgi:DNA-binding NtrC family response regulator